MYVLLKILFVIFLNIFTVYKLFVNFATTFSYFQSTQNQMLYLTWNPEYTTISGIMTARKIGVLQQITAIDETL